MAAIILRNDVDARIPQPPQELRGKLVFGDIEQIKALRAYEQQIGVFDDPEMREWIIDISVSYDDRVRVFATSRDEAVDKARGEFSLDDIDVDYFAHLAPVRAAA